MTKEVIETIKEQIAYYLKRPPSDFRDGMLAGLEFALGVVKNEPICDVNCEKFKDNTKLICKR